MDVRPALLVKAPTLNSSPPIACTGCFTRYCLRGVHSGRRGGTGMSKFSVRWLLLAYLLGWGGLAPAQVVEKVVDLTFYGDENGTGVGGYAPLKNVTQHGSNLWFTTSKGGAYDAGTISRLDLISTTVVQVASLDNVTGKASQSPLLIISNHAYFTTVNGGTGNKGTLAKIDLTSGAITTLHDFASSGLPTGATPRGGLTPIGEDLWGMTSLGGASNRGALFRYRPHALVTSLVEEVVNDLTNLIEVVTTGTTEVVADFDGAVHGGQPYDSLLHVGDAYYFTTFTGGSTFGAPGLSLGAGTLARLTFDGGGTAVITRLIDLPAGHTQFPANSPVLYGTNHLYFSTVGPNGMPGAIVRYDLDTGYWTNEFNFITNTPNPTLYGRQAGYNALSVWQDKLYFMTRQGGSNNTGVIAIYDPAAKTVTKLADLTGTNGLALGSASGSFNGGTVVEWQGRFYLYYPVTTGGASNRGTIVRVHLPAPPVELATTTTYGETNLVITWEGGYVPFTVQRSADLTLEAWTDVAVGITNRSVELPYGHPVALFRVWSGP